MSAHCPLMRPEASVICSQQATRFAAVLGAPVVNTDESYRLEWVSLAEAWPLMKYTPRNQYEVYAPEQVYLAADAERQVVDSTGGRSFCGR